MKIKKHLGFKSLRESLSETFRHIQDQRQAHKIDYSLHDAMMSGFACMYFQDPSLLQFQKRLETKYHSSNLKTLFGIHKIPESTQLRWIIDGVDSSKLSSFFTKYFYRLQRGKHLKQFELFENLYLCALDGAQYFSSGSVSCKGCLMTRHKKKKGAEADLERVDFETQEYSCLQEKEDSSEEEPGLRYSHKVLQAAIMHPDLRQVIPLMPEEICITDGQDKQDCEMNGAKRLIPQIRKDHPQLGLIVTGDDLFSKQPIIEDIKAQKMHYIFVAKPTSHTYLADWLSAYPELHKKDRVDEKNVRHVYEWMNDVPLHGGKEAIHVNYLSYRMLKKDKKGVEKETYRNSWITDLEVTEKTVETFVKGGRCRWKIENECFNTLKNQGYCIEHNYGHGEKNLCFNFYLLTLIAFTFHQVFELTDKMYQIARGKLGSKRHLWETLRTCIKLMIFDSWEHLVEFMMKPEDFFPEHAPQPSG